MKLFLYAASVTLLFINSKIFAYNFEKINYPKCVDCKHLVIDNNILKKDVYEYATCKKYVDVDLVSGEVKQKYAFVCRSSKSFCDEIGNGFELNTVDNDDNKWESSIINTDNILNTISVFTPYFVMMFTLLFTILVHHKGKLPDVEN